MYKSPGRIWQLAAKKSRFPGSKDLEEEGGSWRKEEGGGEAKLETLEMVGCGH